MIADDAGAMVARWKASLSVAGRPNEWEGKQLLRQTGIHVPRGTLVGPGEAIGSRGGMATPAFPSPYAVKVCSADVLHKTDRDGVALGIQEGELDSVVARMRGRFPDAAILVEEMVRYSGCEVILGALRDPTFGPAVMVGAGGILTELYRDVSFRLAPCPKEEALRMLEELTIYPALRGYRGLSADVDSLAAIVEGLAELAAFLVGPGTALDVNPVVWTQDRWVALDVKIVLA